MGLDLIQHSLQDHQMSVTVADDGILEVVVLSERDQLLTKCSQQCIAGDEKTNFALELTYNYGKDGPGAYNIGRFLHPFPINLCRIDSCTLQNRFMLQAYFGMFLSMKSQGDFLPSTYLVKSFFMRSYIWSFQ